MAVGSKTTKALVWILMGMLILGLGGFGITNLGGSLRSVGEVGSKSITIDSYQRALQQTLRSQTAQDGRPLSFAQAQARQLDRLTLAQLIATRALDHETSELGLSVGDDILAERILETRAFAGVDGKFNRAMYADMLDRQGLSESQYEAILREETARGILEQAVFSDIEVSDTYTKTIVDFIGARRSFAWAEVTEDMLDAPLPELSDAALETFHSENTARYMRPAIKKITYVLLTPEMIIDEVEVDEATLRAAYDERADSFNTPERRLVERLVFGSAEDATTAIVSLEAGGTTFEALVQDRGLELGDVDMGDVTLADLGDAGAEVFAAKSGDVVGPLKTDLGSALFRVNGVLPAQATSFEEASAELRDELAQDRVRRVIDGRIEAIEDLLAGGATLEDIDAETDMQLGTLDWHTNADEGPSGYAGFRAAAELATLEDFPELITLEDGSLLALRLDGEEEASLRPFAEVRDTVAEDARDAALSTALTAKAEALRTQLTPGVSFESLGLAPQLEDSVTRSAFIQKAPAALILEAFAMDKPEDVSVVASDSKVVLVRLQALLPPDDSDSDLATTRLLLEQQLKADLSQDLFQMFVTDIEQRIPVSLDENAINAVNAQFQ